MTVQQRPLEPSAPQKPDITPAPTAMLPQQNPNERAPLEPSPSPVNSSP
jgi:hypothetical protein